jgi:hypothetical protein
MSSTDPQSEQSPKDSLKKSFGALATNLDWKKDKSLLLMACGAVLAIVILVLIPRSGAGAKIQTENPVESSPTQTLASMAATMRPDLEVTSVDTSSQTVTFKDKNGAVSTFKLDTHTKRLVPMPAVPGNVAEDPQPSPGEQSDSTLSGMLPWMPVYPATTPEIVFSSVKSEGETQMIAKFKSSDKPVAIVRFYQAKLQENGLMIEAASSGESSGMIRAHDAEKKRMFILNVDAQETGSLSRIVAVQKK